MEKAMFAAGCFWGVEAAFRKIPGVTTATCGYSGGHTEKPSYKEVCTGTTGHAEVVEVEFDPAATSFEKLLEAFWSIHDPTTLNRQGPDVGTQYRSAIYYYSEEQRTVAEASKAKVQEKYSEPVVTEVTAVGPFYAAEEYHQQYFAKQCRL